MGPHSLEGSDWWTGEGHLVVTDWWSVFVKLDRLRVRRWFCGFSWHGNILFFLHVKKRLCCPVDIWIYFSWRLLIPCLTRVRWRWGKRKSFTSVSAPVSDWASFGLHQSTRPRFAWRLQISMAFLLFTFGHGSMKPFLFLVLFTGFFFLCVFLWRESSTWYRGGPRSTA